MIKNYRGRERGIQPVRDPLVGILGRYLLLEFASRSVDFIVLRQNSGVEDVPASGKIANINEAQKDKPFDLDPI